MNVCLFVCLLVCVRMFVYALNAHFIITLLSFIQLTGIACSLARSLSCTIKQCTIPIQITHTKKRTLTLIEYVSLCVFGLRNERGARNVVKEVERKMSGDSGKSVVLMTRKKQNEAQRADFLQQIQLMNSIKER